MANKKIVKKTVQNHKRKLSGVVTSTKMTGTVVISVTTRKPHPLYGKVVKTSKKYKADLNGMDLKEGDRVIIEESRKLSREKKWIVISK